MPGGGRRLPRTVRGVAPSAVTITPGEVGTSRYSALGVTNIPTLPVLENPSPPKHFPFPSTPMENELVFEGMMFLYTLMVAGLQYLHLYRSVWWLPHSYNNSAMVSINTFKLFFKDFILVLSLNYAYQ